MRRWILMTAVWLLASGAASAQFPFFPCPPRPGLGFNYQTRNFAAWGAWYPSYFGYSRYWNSTSIQSTIIVRQPTVVVPPSFDLNRIAELLPREPEDRPNDPPFNPEQVRVFRPRPGGLAELPPPRKVNEPPPVLPKNEQPKRLADPPLANKIRENERQNQLGLDALKAGEPGRAVERFREAIRVTPDEPMSHLLLAQALFARGKFREATASILSGMKLKPDWPMAEFSPRTLVGPNAGSFLLQLDQLRQAVERNPDEPALLFLFGHQLWFDGRRDDAKQYFRQAAGRAADPKPIESFLKADGPLAGR